MTPEERALLQEVKRAVDSLLAGPAQGPYYAVPQQTTQPPVTNQHAPLWVCPVHGQPAKYVAGGVSRRTGRPYNAFYACSVSFCDQRPPRNGPQTPQEGPGGPEGQGVAPMSTSLPEMP